MWSRPPLCIRGLVASSRLLRVTAKKRCEYEWGVHVTTFASAAGFTSEQIVATVKGGSRSDCWDEREQLLIEGVDQICDTATIDDDTYPAFQATWTVEQQLEILSLCGNYHLVCFVANTSRITNEANAALFPR